MKLTTNDRNALSQAILSFVSGTQDFSPTKSFDHAEVFGEWAQRVREGTESAGQGEALRFLHALPYTHPPIDEDNTPEEDTRAAAFLLAIAKVNGGSVPSRSRDTVDSVVRCVVCYITDAYIS